MSLKFFSPKTPGIRFRVNINKKNLNLVKFKKLFFSKKNNSGRNNQGKITVRHIGSGIFNFRRKVDFFRTNFNKYNNFISYDIDKKYTTFLGLIKYDNGCVKYILAPDNLKKNQSITTTFSDINITIGNTMPLGWISNSLLIFNLELTPFSGGKIARSAGTFCRIILHREETVLIQLPSKKRIYISKYCLATLGRASNLLHFLKNYGKAGVIRYHNIRPSVRGETMNPVDHPNGGRTRGGKPRKNPWGKIIK